MCNPSRLRQSSADWGGPLCPPILLLSRGRPYSAPVEQTVKYMQPAAANAYPANGLPLVCPNKRIR